MKYAQYFSEDPFPDIPPALLNSADIYNYVKATGMIFPFYPENLAGASYRVAIGEKVIWWDEEKQEVCGGIASGKTTLAGILEKKGYTAVYERFEDNPFLNQFYQDKEQDNMFETEIVFALLHYNQIKQKQHKGFMVSVYSMLQDYCYGVQNLSGNEKVLFENMYRYLSGKLIPVNLIIYLKCGEDCLLERIKERNRDMETSVSKDYLKNNIEVLERSLDKEEALLVIDSEKYDFREPEQGEVIKLIEETLAHYM